MKRLLFLLIMLFATDCYGQYVQNTDVRLITRSSGVVPMGNGSRFVGVNLGVLPDMTNDNFVVNTTDNTIGSGCNRCLIAGGGSDSWGNWIGAVRVPAGTDYSPTGWATDSDYVTGFADVATIGGGYDNICNQLSGLIAGGSHNFMKYDATAHSTISGGAYNLVEASAATIGGGTANAITNGCDFSGVFCGFDNEVSGSYSVIPGGRDCDVSGDYSFAFGRRAKATATGAMVFADSQDADFTISTQNMLGLRFHAGIKTDAWLAQDSNTVFGVGPLGAGNLAHTSGSQGYSNTAIGYQAGYAMTYGGLNTALGAQSLYSNTTGTSNIAVGYQALYGTNTGTKNFGCGYQAGVFNTDGVGNIYFGYASGAFTSDGATHLTTPDYCTYIGYDTRASADNVQNETAIGNGAIGSGANTVTLGNTSVTGVYTTGNVVLGADNQKLILGESGTGDSYIQFNGTNLQFVDAVTGAKTLAELAAGGTTGIADGNLLVVDDADNLAVGDYATVTASGIVGLTDAQVKADLQIAQAVGTINADGADVVDWSANHFWVVTVDTNETLTFTDPAAAGESLRLVAIQSGGTNTLAFSGETIYWPDTDDDGDGDPPTFPSTDTYRIVYTFLFDGTNYYATGYSYGLAP